MPLECEEHSVGDPDGAEHTPPAEQANLAGRQRFLASVHNVIVVQNESMHVLILADASHRPLGLWPCYVL
jgi:hypothetical protein